MCALQHQWNGESFQRNCILQTLQDWDIECLCTPITKCHMDWMISKLVLLQQIDQTFNVKQVPGNGISNRMSSTFA